MKYQFRKKLSLFLAMVLAVSNLAVTHVAWADEIQEGDHSVSATSSDASKEYDLESVRDYTEQYFDIKVPAMKEVTIKASPSDASGRGNVVGSLKAGTLEQEEQTMGAVLWFPLTEFKKATDDIVLSLTLKEDVGADFSYGEVYLVPGKEVKSSSDWETLNQVIEENGILAGSFEKDIDFAGEKGERLLVPVTGAVETALDMEWNTGAIIIMAGDEGEDNAISFYSGNRRMASARSPMLMTTGEVISDSIEIVAVENTYVQGGQNADQQINSFANEAQRKLLRNKYTNNLDTSNFIRMSIIKFPIPPIGDQAISDYRLKLTVQKVEPDMEEMEVYTVKESWGRDSLTFNQLTDLLNGKTPSMNILRSDITFLGANSGYVEVSVKELVEEALTNGEDTLSLAFKIPTRATNNGIEFYSIEHETASNHPRIIKVLESQKPIESLKMVSVLTYIGQAPTLPETVTAVLEGGDEKEVPVTWDAVPAEQYAQTGTFSVKGSVEGTAVEAEAIVTVKKKITSDAVEISASRDAYIQKGDCSDQVYNQWTNPAWSADEIRVKNSNSNQSYTRNGYVIFPLDQNIENIEDNNQVKLILTLVKAEPGWNNTSVSLLKTTEFSYDTITYNTAPEAEAEACGIISSTSMKAGKVSVDVTDVVLEALAEGKTEIGFMLENTIPEDSNGIRFHSERAAEANTAPILSFTKEAIREVEAVEVETELKVAPILPNQVQIIDPMNGGMVDVLWDEIEEESYGKIGTFTVHGVLKEYEYQVSATVKVVLPKDYIPKTYYVDATGGNDANTGLSEETAWKSLDKISETMFLPGDSILLKAGEIWNGYVKLRGSGVEGKPITLSSYGEGRRPVLNGGGTGYAKRSATVLLDTEEYWEISNLEVTNKKAGEDFHKQENTIYSRSGILIYTTDQADRKDHIYVTDCYVHDVVSNGNDRLPDTFGGKLSGGIIFIASYQDLNGIEIVPITQNKAGHVDIRAERNIVKNVVTEGIRNSVEGPSGNHPINCDEVYIGNNYIEGTLGDGIVLNQTKTGGLVEKNIVIDAGTAFNNGLYYAAAWVHFSHDAVFQYNEVYGMLYGNADGEAFDADNQCYGTVFQYNYSHDNNGGACLFMGTQHNSVFRYNVSVNDGWKIGEEILNDHSNPGVNNSRVPLVYNNTFYLGNERNKNTNLYGYTKPGFSNFRNNVVLVSEAVAANNNLKFSKAKTVDNSIIENNYFSDENIFSTNRPSIEILKGNQNFFGDPMLVSPELASVHDDDTQRNMSLAEVEALLEDPLPSLRSRVSIFAPQENSPLIGAGIPIEGNDLTEDILGNPINKEHPAIGAIEPKTVAEYEITVEAGTGGDVQSDVNKAKAGDTIALTVMEEEGYNLKRLWIAHGETEVDLVVTENKSSFTMPANDVTVKAVFEEEKPVITRYKITSIAEGGGTVHTDKTMAQKGEMVTVTAVPDANMVLSSITCKSGEQSVSMTVTGNTASFTMPEGDVTVKAVFEEDAPVITRYKITSIAEGGGTVHTDKTMAQKGEMVTVTAVPNRNMVLSSITCKSGEQSVPMTVTGNTASFAMPEGDVTITVQFTAIVQESDDDDSEDIVVTTQPAPIPDSWPGAEWKKHENGQWTLLKKDGNPAIGWAADAGKWYYLNPETGMMQTGWALVDNKWYYLGINGDMLTNWISIDGIWYYCDETGKLLMDTITPDGYRVGKSGAWIQ